MTQRTNLTTKHNPIKYVLGSILLLTISGLGIVWMGQDKNESVIEETIVSKTPTVIIEKEELVTTATTVATIVPTIKLIESYENPDDGFAVKYENKRKLLIENEESGKRFVFSNSLGNITVHVGKKWSWLTSERIYTDNLLIDGEKSYVYEISNQKIVDVEKNDNKYTIQCVHNGRTELKIECEKFLENFQFI
ncbi:MAG: hypothetical protein US68_C0010G0051 [Candidatus Shapirobacteria bacterium GW2011_GWE1_38_10]|uniref:Uncharacterized protein n=1 Tax=Candidatus Shapirobacteria bacterium GW2011_GWE1_38_10 TaxID=1618488 RepID=A0A0G0I5S5_9BACT|nr:MAG: hypothetical protein US46_C0013G0006 [Candidatus Shapirobacteria bacterium GW2011_GWF2_37_20]KKQ49917.1 MAG: hypothetical protein US68_C0010G0051 [Candidatus Shapirobacteria bacterium GW2011_GWE1_38_10]KKQ64345.1 MAG: hypothetical protein US85_C0011G0002 [Candidatus Shapirobacteria bacterium GW2011_GWF1_38_23]HBP51539.1 hypothetical protein [Candidatus Shapirobacteria bacterium]